MVPINQQQNIDVIIVGGGLAGLTLARQLKLTKPDISVLVVEKNNHPVIEAAFKVGESTVELGTFYLREVLGLKAHLDSRQLPKAGLRFFFSFNGNEDVSRRLEVGLSDLPPVPSHQIDRGRFENELGVLNYDLGVVFWDGCKVLDISLGEEGQLHKILVRQHANEVEVQARWVVDATGRTGLLKRHLNLAEPTNHAANATWFRVRDVVDVDDWVTDTQWLGRVRPGIRRLSTNHLMGPGYWVWLIPLSSGGTSIGIVVDAKLHPMNCLNRFEKVLRWLQKNEPQLASIIEVSPHTLQDFRVLKHYSHSCKRVFSPNRWALTGEAGVFTDPFYSPGTDFIAISNTFITDLIIKDLSGEKFQMVLEYYNRTYISLFKEFLALYEGQYPLMGNPRLCMTKIMWDWSVYWGVIALLFFNGKMSDLHFMAHAGRYLQTTTQLNVSMQRFFQKWGKLETNIESVRDTFVDLLDIEFLHKLHRNLESGLADDLLMQRLERNLDIIGAAATAIMHMGYACYPDLQNESRQITTIVSGLHVNIPSVEVKRGIEQIWC